MSHHNQRLWLVFFVLRTEGGEDYLALIVRTKKTEGGDFLCERKRDYKGLGVEEGVKVLGESEASFHWVWPWSSQWPQEGWSQETVKVLPGRGTRKCNGLKWEQICFYKIGIICSTTQGLSQTGTGKSAPSLNVLQALPDTVFPPEASGHS